MVSPSALERSASYHVDLDPSGTLTLALQGRLDSASTGAIWKRIFRALADLSPKSIIVNASEISYCDGSGIGLLLELERYQKAANRKWAIQGLAPEYQRLLELYKISEVAGAVRGASRFSSFEVEVGRATIALWREIRDLTAFVGELGTALFKVIIHPRLLKWKDVFLTAEKAGVNALPIIALLGFLIGLILSFQSAISLRQFGADLFVADLVGLSLFRELGPLITAIILAGRSGSAFAAEIGTMKVNEEIDALTTMGIDPVRFLVVAKVIAALIVTPLLTVFTNLFGLIGSVIVYTSLGFPLVTFIQQLQTAVTHVDFLGGIAKSFVFGALIAGVGCLRGLRTKTGASAVGDSTTQAVVSGIVLIVIADGIFSVIYYYLGI